MITFTQGSLLRSKSEYFDESNMIIVLGDMLDGGLLYICENGVATTAHGSIRKTLRVYYERLDTLERTAVTERLHKKFRF